MKIFATADIHGNRKIVDKLFAIERSVDLILVCGDIGGKQYSFNSFREFSEKQKEDRDYLHRLKTKSQEPHKKR